MRKIFPVCCAEATAPHHEHESDDESPSHFGFWIFDFRLSERMKISLKSFHSSAFPQSKSEIENLKCHLMT